MLSQSESVGGGWLTVPGSRLLGPRSRVTVPDMPLQQFTAAADQATTVTAQLAWRLPHVGMVKQNMANSQSHSSLPYPLPRRQLLQNAASHSWRPTSKLSNLLAIREVLWRITLSRWLRWILGKATKRTHSTQLRALDFVSDSGRRSFLFQ